MTDTPIENFDVVILGAGINGAGVFRDLCEQGLKCLIIDKGDFGSGTSAAPSRLIHGGLKYLETGELRLVAESTYERNLLMKNAAHLVRPLPTAIPILSWTKGVTAALRTLFRSTTAPRSRGALLVKVGLSLYDHYGSRARQMPRHRMITRRKALAEIPALTPRIVALGTYYDATISAPERLVLELIEDGQKASPESRAMNWCGVTGTSDGTLHLKPETGEGKAVRPRFVVNATGPWIDRVNGLLGLNSQYIGGTKGSHVLLDHPALLRQLDGRMLYFEADDGRILLVVPFQGKALVGSTDIPSADPDSVACTDDETHYFMQSLHDLLPGLEFNRDQIVYAYAGIRPLPNSQGVAPGLISRDHSALKDAATPERPFPILSLVGGKWTTFRAFSAEVTDTVLADLNAPRLRGTDEMPIGGGRGMPRTTAERTEWIIAAAQYTGAAPERLETLLDRYGTTARDIARHEGIQPKPLIDAPEFTEPELDWIVRNESVVHLADVLLRRTPLAISGHLTPKLCCSAATIAAAALGWTAERKEAELKRLAALLAERHGVHLDFG
ncbi:glycerol-3-phosphate dehydrogenase/oxidase [Antarctobacter heliothermus]|uniref:Glycerol-3-phosphate dehydrogenase n=1 Tax=Antarctobacter heliothermus TaxID=74033 RepID=A0A239CY41_9RHOB|nr:glycerol-3-phosphate dehydrogenase/oxidase [Antarctobacter heliothermus]SNS25020.1 glycerol-3-phosphate dehydrogenase [Antarctobacter heliothermus]